MKATVKIRIATVSDVPALVSIYRPYVEETTVSFEYITPTIEEFTNRVTTNGGTYPYLVAEYGEKIVGYAYGSRYGQRAGYDWCAELSVYLAPEGKGMSIGKKLYETAIAIMTYQGVYRLYAIIAHPNQPSVIFHEKMGFVEHGRFPNCGYKHGSWHDLIHMERELKKADLHPLPVVPMGDLSQEYLDQVLYEVNHNGQRKDKRAYNP